MKILYDLSSAQPQGTTVFNGGGEYAYRIFCALLDANKGDQEIEVLLNSERGKLDRAVKLCEQSSVKIQYFKGFKQLQRRIIRAASDVLVLPVCYPEYGELKLPNSIRVISVMHDLSSLAALLVKNQYGKFSGNKIEILKQEIEFRLKRNELINKYIEMHEAAFHINNNQLMITDAHYTKAAMQYYLNGINHIDIQVMYAPEKISVVENCSEKEILKKNKVEQGKYFLLVSGCRWAKNNLRAAKALDRLFGDKRYQDLLKGYKVLILGSDSQFSEKIDREIKYKNQFIIKGYVSNQELDVLYQNTHLFIYPSLIEGFGYPPIEAMSKGTVCACSTSTSIPEICGDGVLYFDPYDIDMMSIIFLQSFDERLRNEKKRQALNRFKVIKERQQKSLHDMVYIILEKEISWEEAY